MKKGNLLYLLTAAAWILASNLFGQVGYFDAPYVRYEADQGTLTNASALAKSYNQGLLQSEASEQVCVNMTGSGAAVSWPVTAAGDGLVVRYCVPDGESAVLEVFANGVSVGTLTLTTYYSWEYLSSNGNPNNVGVSNNNPKMRFDEVRMRLPSQIPSGGTLRLVRQSGNIYLDFAELEPVPAAIPAAGGNAVYSGNGSNLQTFIDGNGGNTIYLPAGVYNVNRELYFGVNGTVLKGAGMWYTQINFTNGNSNQGGLVSNASNVSYSGLYLTTTRNSRSSSYKAINGVYTSGSTITNVWAEHFECGAWIAQYNTGPSPSDGFRVSNCRFRNNYADGINLCKGTRNAIVEHSNFRNNGDDDMAIWSADNMECQNNTFQYNTSENCWRASGVAIYGGYNNKAHHILIQDNLEVGIKVNNAFGGAGFNGGGMHELSNIIIKRCGTQNDLFNASVGAIEMGAYNNGAGTRVQNVKFSCIDIIDSKNNAIEIKKSTGDGFYNIVFENIKIDGTGREYPNNGGAVGGRGFGLLFKGYPNGNGTYCGLTYANRAGSAGSDVSTGEIGSFSWNAAGSCPGGCSLGSATTTVITSASTFGVCNNPVTLTATTTIPTSNTVSYIEFFVDGVSVGQDNSSPYSAIWNNPTVGNHPVVAVAHFAPSSTISTSPTQVVSIADAIYSTPAPPAIDGTIEASWSSYATQNITKVSGGITAPDLAAYFKTRYDATNLYILVDVTDDALVRNGTGGTWEDDGVEIFIDMGNDKSTTYAGSDFQYSFNWNSAAILENKHGATSGVTLGQANRTGGYIMEIKIPWSTLGTTPSAGSFIGFDVAVNDDDNNGTRDNQMSWNDGSFLEYDNPSLFGTLQIAGCNNPLPVTLIEFTGVKEAEAVILNWATATEKNNKKFVVERTQDFSEWKVLGEVLGVGQSTTIQPYQFVDQQSFRGTAYYRLKQIDEDGASSHSTIVAVQSGEQSVITVAPNPFDDVFTINYPSQEMLTISIYDTLGKLMYLLNQKNEGGMLYIEPNLPSGAYIITVQTETSLVQQKLIKK